TFSQCKQSARTAHGRWRCQQRWSGAGDRRWGRVRRSNKFVRSEMPFTRSKYEISGGRRMRQRRAWAIFVTVVFGLVLAGQAAAQDKDKDAKAPEAKGPEKCEAAKEDSSVTDHTIKIGPQTIPYKATASTTLLKNDKGDYTGLLYSVAYTRSDVKDLSTRPVSFLYNGGPGSASMWLHMGAFGPRRAYTVDGQFTPPAPYKLVDNGESLLDKTDLVFIDAMGTGYSHAVCKAQE